MSNSTMIVARFKRAIRYRKWTILLFAFVGAAGVLTSRALRGSTPDLFSIAIQSFNMAVIATVIFMIRDRYSDNSHNEDGGE